MDATALGNQLVELSSPFKVFSAEERRLVGKFCEVSKKFLQEQARKTVAGAENRAVLYHYGSDGTPLLVQKRFTQHAGGRTVRRSGGSGTEFLVERGFVKSTTSLGEEVLCYLGRDPRPLTEGKTSWEMFTACCEFFPLAVTLRSVPGITIYQYVFDRLMKSAMETKILQRQRLFLATPGLHTNDGQKHLQDLCSWVVVLGCSLHDCHNSLLWGLRSVLGGAIDETKALHITIASVRNGYSLLQTHLQTFLMTSLAVDDHDVTDTTPVYRFWVSCGLESDLADRLATLNLRFVDGYLRVGKMAAHAGDFLESVSYCLVSVARFKAFSDSRWISMGESCRSLMCSLLLGLERWMACTRQQPNTSDYYLHGFDQCSIAVKEFVCITAFVSRVPDAVLLALMGDDRLGLNAEEVHNMMMDEFTWLEEVLEQVWAEVVRLIPPRAPAWLRQQVLHASQVCIAFMENQFFELAFGYPWKLCRGDRDAELDMLAQLPEHPIDPIASRIKSLLELDFNRTLLHDALDRLGECRWTTNVHEQGHASASLIHRAHRSLGTTMLTARAHLHMVKPLLTAFIRSLSNPLEDKKLQKIRRRREKKLTGRHLFFSDFMTAKKLTNSNIQDKAKFLHQVMKEHNAVWLSLPPAVRQDYELKAVTANLFRTQELETEEQAHQGQQNLNSQRLSEEALLDAQQLRLTNCQWSPSDMEAFGCPLQFP